MDTINFFCNLLTFLSSLLFFIILFGHEESSIYNYPKISIFSIKISLIIICMHAFYDAFTLKNDNIYLNSGLAIFFSALCLEKVCMNYGILCIRKCKKKKRISAISTIF